MLEEFIKNFNDWFEGIAEARIVDTRWGKEVFVRIGTRAMSIRPPGITSLFGAEDSDHFKRFTDLLEKSSDKHIQK